MRDQKDTHSRVKPTHTGTYRYVKANYRDYKAKLFCFGADGKITSNSNKVWLSVFKLDIRKNILTISG